MLFNKVKQTVIKHRVKKACQELDIANDVTKMGNGVIEAMMAIYKAPLESLPVIEEAIKRHPEQIANVAVEIDKIADSAVKASEIIMEVFNAEKGVLKQIEGNMNAATSLDVKLNKQMDACGKKVSKNLKKVRKILLGG